MTSTAMDWAPAWVVISGPAPTKVAQRHRDRADQHNLPNARAEQHEPEIAQRDAKSDADGDVHTAAQPLPVRHAEDEDGRDCREVGHLVAEQLTREEPGAAGRYRALDDHEGSLPPPVDPAHGGCSTAPDGSAH